MKSLSNLAKVGRTHAVLKALFLIAANACLFSSSAFAQVSLVRVTGCGPATFPGTACTIPATGSGNLIVVGWQMGGGANTTTTTASVSDNAGNVYSQAGAARSIDTAGGSMIDIWYAKNSLPGATSVVITPSASTGALAVIWEFDGVDTVAPLDKTVVLSNQPATATPAGGAVTLSSTNQAVVSIVVVANQVTGIFPGNPFINDSLLNSNGWAHLISSSLGTYNAQWSQNAAGTYTSSTVSFKAGSASAALNSCDLSADGSVNVVDVTLAVNMVLGTTPCSANIQGPGICDVVTVQRVVNSVLGGTCVTGSGTVSHSVALSWTASISPGVTGYNVYRATVSGGPYTKINTSTLIQTNYVDNAVQGGQTYYYVATAVDGTGAESSYSTQIQAIVPSP